MIQTSFDTRDAIFRQNTLNQTQKFNADSPPSIVNTKTKVLKVCLENKRNFIAGVGAVLRGLRAANEQLELDKIDSIHPLYTKDKKAAENFVFQGVVKHQYEGKEVISSIYRDKENHEYVVNPDPRYQELFDLPENGQVYGSKKSGQFVERNLYFGSAVAAFSDQYRGKKGNKTFDIVHIDSNSVSGITIPLIQNTNEKRKEKNFPTLKTLFVMHGKLEESMKVSGSQLKKIGHKSSTLYPDVVKIGMETADHVVFVSSAIASDALSDNPEINCGHKALLQKDRVSSILNGIDADKFDITNENTLKEFALKKTYDENGVETTDYVAYRQKIKKLLFDAGHIANADLPLVLYIGRYAPEKGIDILLDLIENTPKNNAQFVTMGVTYGEDERIRQIKSLQEHSHQATLRCYDSMKEQDQFFKESNVSIKQLIRAAAEIFVMPSHLEPCGLAAMEAQCAGTLLIAPENQGLKEICKPSKSDTVKDFFEADVNSITYKNHESFVEANDALKKALSLFEKMTIDEKNSLARKIHAQAMINYNWVTVSKEKITGPYIAYHTLYNKLAGKDLPPKDTSLKPLIAPPKQAPITPTPFIKKSLLKRISTKVSVWANRFFRLVSGTFKRIYLLIKTKLLK